MDPSTQLPNIARGAAAGAAAIALPLVTLPATAVACVLAAYRAEDGTRTIAALVAFAVVVTMVVLAEPSVLFP